MGWMKVFCTVLGAVGSSSAVAGLIPAEYQGVAHSAAALVLSLSALFVNPPQKAL